MEKVFIKTDGSLEMNRKVVSHLMSLGGLKYDFDSFVYHTTQQGVSLYTLRTDTRVIGWGYTTEWADHNKFKEILLPESSPSKRHPHYDLIVKWASDPTQKVWVKKDGGWKEIKGGCWMNDKEYFVGKIPPVDLEPVLFKDAKEGAVYYVTSVSHPFLYYQNRLLGEPDMHLFDRKLVYSTPEGAIKRAKEMLGIND